MRKKKVLRDNGECYQKSRVGWGRRGKLGFPTFSVNIGAGIEQNNDIRKIKKDGVVGETLFPYIIYLENI